MATNQEMFQFLSNFGPMLGELAAQVAFLDRRIELLEQGARAPEVAAAPELPADESIEFMGQKIDVKGMLEAGMPKGGFTEMMERMKNWKPPTAPAPAAATPAPAPAVADTPTS